MSVPLLVMHAPGALDGAAPWKAAMTAARWNGETVAFDIPGHGDAEPPVGGHFDFVDPAFQAVAKLGIRLHDDRFVVVGVGASGWAATLLGLADTAQALVLVDGVGAPFLTVADRADRRSDRLRALVATAADPGEGRDPRWDHPVTTHHRLSVATEAAAELKIPTLLLESPASEATAEEIDQIVAAGRQISVTHIADAAPETVAPAVVEWCDGLSLESGF